MVIFEVFYDLSWNVAIRNKIDLSKKILPTNKIQYPRDLKQLDHLMLDIFNYNKDLLGGFSYKFGLQKAPIDSLRVAAGLFDSLYIEEGNLRVNDAFLDEVFLYPSV